MIIFQKHFVSANVNAKYYAKHKKKCKSKKKIGPAGPMGQKKIRLRRWEKGTFLSGEPISTQPGTGGGALGRRDGCVGRSEEGWPPLGVF